MEERKLQEEQGTIRDERFEIASHRLAEIAENTGLKEEVSGYFRSAASFLCETIRILSLVESGEWDNLSLEEMREINLSLSCRWVRK